MEPVVCCHCSARLRHTDSDATPRTATPPPRAAPQSCAYTLSVRRTLALQAVSLRALLPSASVAPFTARSVRVHQRQPHATCSVRRSDCPSSPGVIQPRVDPNRRASKKLGCFFKIHLHSLYSPTTAACASQARYPSHLSDTPPDYSHGRQRPASHPAQRFD